MKTKRFFFLFLLSIFICQFQMSGCESESTDTSQSPSGVVTPPPAAPGTPPEPFPSPVTPPPPSPVKLCGNGTIDSGEWCDGDKISTDFFGNPMTCTTAFFYKMKKMVPATGTIHCSEACDLDLSQCTPLCGNGKLDPGEECDAVDPVTHQSKSVYCSNDCRIQCAWNGVVGVSGWFNGNGRNNGNEGTHCYFDQRNPQSYGDAEGTCRNMGGHLLILNSAEEHRYVTTQVIQQDVDSTRWIGLRRGTSRNRNQTDNYFENFYWTSFASDVEGRNVIAPELAWKGRHGRAPDAVVSPYEFLQFLWKSGEPNDCGGYGCIYPEEVVEMLGRSSGYQLEDAMKDVANSFICEIEPPVLLP